MKLQHIYKLAFFLCTSFVFINCTSRDNVPEDLKINDFVWSGLNAYYYWQSDVPNLLDNRFSSQENLNNFLVGFQKPEDLFQSLLFQPGLIDRFSRITDDYIALENSFRGITLNNGMEFQLIQNANGTLNVYGVVYYVIPGSDATTKGVLRGMVFSAINGTQLTVTNYEDLLFGENTSYTINLADFNNGNPILNGTSIDLTKSELQENPVAITKVFTEGAAKIGYLLYNQFSSEFDGNLNAAFATFKSENITELIVDLRYNGGGSVRTATYLASMINGTNNGKLFAKEIWNEKVNAAFDESFFVNNFTNEIKNRDRDDNFILQETINSLSLNRVYFIVTNRTASASELVINGLDAYINVNLVGTKTVGKQVGSITLYDSDDLSRNGANLNLNHTYAMQPIVLEIKNANEENEPNGYTPDVVLAEDFGQISGDVNLGVLGSKTDPLLNRTINFIITGNKASGKFADSLDKEALFNSKFARPFSQEMFVDGLKD